MSSTHATRDELWNFYELRLKNLPLLGTRLFSGWPITEDAIDKYGRWAKNTDIEQKYRYWAKNELLDKNKLLYKH